MHHACYIPGCSLTPVWIQPSTNRYRPKRGHYPWKIICVETGEVVAQYIPKYKAK